MKTVLIKMSDCFDKAGLKRKKMKKSRNVQVFADGLSSSEYLVRLLQLSKHALYMILSVASRRHTSGQGNE